MQKAIRLFENCHITKGVSRSVIVDFQRGNLYIIPNEIADLFDQSNSIEYTNIDESKINLETLNKYIDYLISNEICFFIDSKLKENFTKINYNDWDYPAKITNAIVEIDCKNAINIYDALHGLIDVFHTRHIEFSILGDICINELFEFISKFDSFDLLSYNIIFSICDNEHLDDAINILLTQHKICDVILHSTTRNDVMIFNSGLSKIILTEKVFSYKTCGIVEYDQFVFDINHISESFNHNTCLNRKITIDSSGNIRNCPNTNTVFGNIFVDDLGSIIDSDVFKRMSNISKERIYICKHCEFRHVCTDCRAFLENPDDEFSKPLKCGYDPYLCEWTDWSKNPIKKDAMEFYGF